MYPEQQQIYWYSGLYLQPQHFQSMDLHHSYMLAQQRQLAQPWNVGVIKCDINQQTLIDFSLNIDKLRVLLPSGDYLEYPGNCYIEPRQFRDAGSSVKNHSQYGLRSAVLIPVIATLATEPVVDGSTTQIAEL